MHPENWLTDPIPVQLLGMDARKTATFRMAMAMHTSRKYVIVDSPDQKPTVAIVDMDHLQGRTLMIQAIQQVGRHAVILVGTQDLSALRLPFLLKPMATGPLFDLLGTLATDRTAITAPASPTPTIAPTPETFVIQRPAHTHRTVVPLHPFDAYGGVMGRLRDLCRDRLSGSVRHERLCITVLGAQRKAWCHGAIQALQHWVRAHEASCTIVPQQEIPSADDTPLLWLSTDDLL